VNGENWEDNTAVLPQDDTIFMEQLGAKSIGHIKELLGLDVPPKDAAAHDKKSKPKPSQHTSVDKKGKKGSDYEIEEVLVDEFGRTMPR
jgi:hypothetical protein